jgi:hypothetical protein
MVAWYHAIVTASPATIEWALVPKSPTITRKLR